MQSAFVTDVAPTSRPEPGPAPDRPSARFAPGDAELVARVLRGDRWGEEALFRRHAPPLLDALTRLLGRIDQADDAVQDAFVLAFRDLRQLRDPEKFGPWLRRIAVRRARRAQRLNAWRRRLFRSEDDLALDDLAAPGASPEVRAHLAAIDRTLSREKSGARTAWLLVRVEGWTLEEAAEATGTSLATVKRSLVRIDARLARLPRHGSRADGQHEGPREGRS